MSDLVAALLAGGLGVLAGALGPTVMRRLPEPELEKRPEAEEEEPGSRLTFRPAYEKVLYADLPRGLRTVVICAVLSGAVCALLGARLGWSDGLLVAGLAVPAGTWLGYIDARTTFLPTRLIYGTLLVVAVAVLALSATGGDWSDAERSAIGAVAWAAVFYVYWFFGGLGYGDVRLSLLLGAVLGYLGWSAYAVGVFAAVLLGGIVPLLLVVLKLVDPRRNPYGPHMLVGAVIGAGFGPAIATAAGYGALG